jgi:amphi-Trp domain-containing protein
MDMTDKTIYEEEAPRKRRRLSSFFRRLAGRFRHGERIPVDEDQSIVVDPPAEAEMEVELEQEDDDVSLEIELEWPDEETEVETDVVASKATFELYEDSAGDYRWRLRHQNGNVIADGGEGYASKQKAEQGLDSVVENAPGAYIVDQSKDEEAPDEGDSAATFELFEDSDGKWRWRLVHDNGNIIADGSQGYASKQKATQRLHSVQKNVPGAPVEETND